MGGIFNKVKRTPKVEDVTVAINYHHASNGCDELPPRANGITTPSNCFSKQAAVAKVSAVSSLLGKASSIGFGKLMEILDSFGTSITNWDPTLNSEVQTKGTTISILAFEVANSVVKGAKLMQSLSEDEIRYLKDVLLPSKGVQSLISTDMDELLRIAAADKREELSTFSRDVVRFGNHTKDPTWHNLDRYFRETGLKVTEQTYLKKQAERGMEHLITLVQSTAELCHELHSLDRLEREYRHKLEEDSSVTVKRGNLVFGDNLAILNADIKNQMKLVNSLKKKSLWSKTFEEVMPKLVDIVQLLHFKIHEAFGSTDDDEPVERSERNCKRLGSAGTSLHYAHIITQINTLVSRSRSVPQSVIDTLYEGLPCSVKSTLRSKFQLVELTIPQIKAEMKQTLDWLVPIAINTTKALHGFGWVGEWANTGFEASWYTGLTSIPRIGTLHHADEKKTEAYICELVVLLHYLISQAGVGHGGMPSSPVETRSQRTNELTAEDQEMLKDVGINSIRLGMSKSHNFDAGKASRLSRHHRLSKSSRDFLAKDKLPIENLLSRPIDSDITWTKFLDVIDGVDTTCRF
ncbi:hypothetical protein RchiOBHm_Chr6g0272351 [Rosa chinensis]|uniref:DUF668 family protein n=1 Tax=Rosa chinensis TaxID=74649 RepID=A0A2P6PR61_ROSCH|nr:protein PSK SIMULATOR 1 isoform X1 [Rosa chinensis]XP_040363816.1 protein PSK SIMULATOR 1 isoform X1 [Rosa chinensis]PRQ24433.1 hypothetical protein RchiOBHm_Chr6g0272351 [Rosa chinensis]